MALGVDTRTSGADTSVPAATRATTPGWRDPRLWIGLLIVALSVVAGSRLLASADDTVAVWAVAADAGAGAELTDADLVVHRVRFADGDDLSAYYAADDELPATLRLVRAVGAGELLPRAAVGAADAPSDVVELPVGVDPAQVPPSVRAGSVVDVYLLGGKGDAGPVLEEVTVVSASSPESGFGSVGGQLQLVLAVPQEAAADFLAAVGASDQPTLTVVRRS
ncbi:hypothetical protein [Nocardioides mangrovi]|uniref:SAF domain-containing protein n=1 Tax=Nocardioides mangrovi TaxID=2874580 RepID=A0ABS7UH09_9ACTN|nr:hypothetical protein [Nocardioides mangrovi]MBZ5740115.1 hypothetical protein [Nocardioides mangrovi]